MIGNGAHVRSRVRAPKRADQAKVLGGLGGASGDCPGKVSVETLKLRRNAVTSECASTSTSLKPGAQHGLAPEQQPRLQGLSASARAKTGCGPRLSDVRSFDATTASGMVPDADEDAVVVAAMAAFGAAS
jgi:hypothetical protein